VHNTSLKGKSKGTWLNDNFIEIFLPHINFQKKFKYKNLVIMHRNLYEIGRGWIRSKFGLGV
jgi:hypothetical protein